MRKYYLTTIRTPKKYGINKIILAVFLLGGFLFNSNTYAQDADGDGISDVDENSGCTGSTVTSIFINEDFGAGNRTSTPFTNYCYEDGTGTAPCTSSPGQVNIDDGDYAILQFARPYNINTGGSNFAWTTAGDHTGNANGRMAVFNASFAPGEFYNRTITNVIPNVDVDLSLWVKNIVLIGSNIILPNITIEIRDLSNNLLFTDNSGDIPENTTWVNILRTFNPGNNGGIRLILINNAPGGVGNDLVLDDIQLAQLACDTDGDGVANYLDLDSDNDGIPDSIEGNADIDGDSVANFLDLDSDGDGIFDMHEAGYVLNGTTIDDADNNGILDGLPADFGTNGLLDALETVADSGALNYVSLNTDSDASFDAFDVDDDGDGVNTEFEGVNPDGDFNPNTGATQDSDTDATFDYLDVDDDGDGVNTIFEGANPDADGDPSTGLTQDTDTDATFDYLDIDDDGDGVNTIFEGANPDADGDPSTGLTQDTDTDATFDYLDVDDDGDGVNTIFEGANPDADGDPSTGATQDSDADATFDYLDVDDDGDGVNTVFEGTNPDADGDPSTGATQDTDTDVTFDYLDIDDDGDGVYTIFEGANPDADGDPSTGATQDTDTDATFDYLDVDDDGDGVNTIFEGANPDADGDPSTGLTQDTDTDATFDYLDVDDDGDGVNTLFEGTNPDADGDPSTGATQDTDTDATFDYLDVDDDGDGVNTIFEGTNPDADGDPSTGATQDTDTDATFDYLDVDDDGDGVNTIFEGANPDADGDPSTGLTQDTDTDATFDYLDVDDDGDGVNTIFEGSNPDADGDPSTGATQDTDTDATFDYLDVDDDGDGVFTEFENPDPNMDGDPSDAQNTDSASGDTIPDYLDTDDDGDGIDTANENPDPNNDGDPADAQNSDFPADTVPDYLDVDDDNDGIATLDEDFNGDGDPTNDDNDGDGVPNYLDLDSDNDGIPDAIEGNGDSDGDLIPDYLDLDSDNDGISDIIEAGGVDADGDGQIDYPIPGDPTSLDDLNNNGISDFIEANPLPLTDTDSDGVPNYLDLDSDNDGITDATETGSLDVDGDGQIDTFADGNDNGLSDVLEGVVVVLRNTDADTGDTLPDYLDLDSDADGISDIIEAGGIDADGDGHVDYVTPGDPTTLTDINNNGLLDVLEGAGLPIPNTDGTGGEDYIDIDADGDGIVDNIEGQTTAGYVAPANTDIDNDGLDDNYDGDDGNTLGVIDPLGPLGDVNPTNTDGLDNPDYLDLDSDNDGDLDSLEAWDTNNDGVADIVPAPGDADNDGLDNAYDVDDSSLDPTNGGTLPTDFPDLDIPGGDRDWREALDIDWDNDGIDDPIDLDDDNDGIPDTDEGGDVLDTDGDGIPNRYDLDSDNDGIYDIVESGQLNGVTIADGNNDGILDGGPLLFGTNGLLDALETTPDSGTLTNATADSDLDTIPDSNELNADNDGCNDVTEAGFTDVDGGGRLGNDTGLTVDANGVVNTLGLTDGYTTPLDGDSNSIFDFQEVGMAVDLNSQQPSDQTIIINSNANFDVIGSLAPVYQWQESTDSGATWNNIIDGGANPTYGGATTDALTLTIVPASYNGYQYRVILSSPAYACDGDITSDEVVLSMFPDNDADGIPDVTDLDDDNDGIPDTDEGGDVLDTDGDGVPNRFDLDSDNDGIYDIVESGQLNGVTIADGNNDGILDGAPLLFGTNGLLDALETTPDSGTLTNTTADSDLDTIPDSNELNADNDGCNDVTEAGFTDVDGGGRLGNDTGLTVDANGVVNTLGLTDGYTTPLDGDGNSIFDFQEVGMAVSLNLQQPADQTITINSNANFDVLGSSAPVYQWQENDGTGWSTIANGGINPTYSGATSDALTLTLVPGSYNGYQYRVILSSPAYACDGNITSNSALLTVYSDFDGDGVGDPVDLDDDNDGIPDSIELNGLDPLADDDGDLVPNYLDDQPGNAAVGNANGIVEPAYDFDGDNIPNHLDIDSDNDGINDVIEAGHGFADIDNDGFIDGADTGSGTNGLFDGVETDPDVDPTLNYPITDTDNDGNSNFLDADDDNDGIDTIVETPNGDTDGDGVDNHLDIDDDNDGILTATEGTANSDSDSFLNYLDQDSDNDGIADNVEGQTTAGYISPSGTDSDNDGLDDSYDLFDNNTGTDPNNNIATQNGIQAGAVNTDSGLLGGDVTPDYLDQDSDGDNVPDSIEGHDLDENGVADNFPIGDSDNDGLDDSFDGDTSGFGDPNGSIITTNPAADLPDTDGTEDVNYRDFDDDGDGVHTRYEDLNSDSDFANDDTDNNGTPNYLDSDDDGDGVLTSDENPDPNGDGNPADAQDLDADGTPDYLDDDDDNDGIPTADEGTDDPDADGRPNYLDIDDDGDGIMTINETDSDEDGDSHPNYLDLDSDDDGIPDNVEGQTTADYETPTGSDSDNDGLDDAYDNFDNNANNVLANYEEGNGIQPVNTDGTDDEDYLDDDSDNDNVPDFVEGHDFDADGNPDIEASGNDTDGDGLDDAYDSSSDFSDPNGLTITTGPAADLPNRDQSLFAMFSPTTAITPDAEVDYRDTDDDGDGLLTNSTGADGEDTDSDGNPRNDNCNGPPDNNSPNYLDPVPCNFIPSGFSPNGDNQNEEFIINQLSQYPNFTMEVYDRWGNIVYEYSNNGRAEPLWWDGFSTGSRTLDKGQKVPVGTYYYVIEYNQDGRKPIAGWVYINY